MAEVPITRIRDEVDPGSELYRLYLDPSAEATREWIEQFLTVQTEFGQIVPFHLYPQQLLMLNDEEGRDVTVKGRQTRASSLKMARNLRAMTTGQFWGATCVVGAQDDQTTQGVFRRRIRHHIYNDLIARGVKLNISTDNEKELVIGDFDNRFVWVSGEQKTLGRGFAAQIIHFSEFAHWTDKALELMGGAIPAVPPYPHGRVDLESTPKGEQGAFYNYGMVESRQYNPLGLWSVHLYPWWLEPRYRVGDDPNSGADIILSTADLNARKADFSPTDIEHRLMAGENHNGQHLTVEQILWRRFRKAAQDATNAPFLQEYPESLDTCWLGTAGKFFDTSDGVDHLEYYRETRREPVRYMERLTYRGDEVSFHGPNLAIWEMPDQTDDYVAAFDAAGGGIGTTSDWSVLYVMSVRKEKVVARLRLQTSPKSFAVMVAAVAGFYKTATVNGERSHHGDMVFTEMRDLAYSNIYYHVDPTKPLSRNERAQPGMYPTAANRQAVLEKLKMGVANNALECFCPEFIREANNFTWQKFQHRMKAQALDTAGLHDDCVMALAYTWYIIDKARRRLQRATEDRNNDVVIVGPNNLVVRRGDAAVPRASQVWFT